MNDFNKEIIMFKMNDFDKIPTEFRLSIPKSLTLAILIVVCLQFIASVISLPAYFMPELTNFTLPLSFLVGGGIAIFVSIAFVKTNWNSIKEHILKPTSLAIIFLSILLYFLLLPFAELMGSLVPTEGIPFLENLYKSLTETFEMMLDYKVAGFITVCILAPIIEEILFRGILLRGLLQNGTSPIIAILLSSVLFGLAHMNPWQFLGAGLLGAIFGFVYFRTKSLWLCMFLHALNNSISFIMMIQYGTMEESVSNPNNYLLVSLLFVIAVFVAWTIHKLTLNRQRWI